MTGLVTCTIKVDKARTGAAFGGYKLEMEICNPSIVCSRYA
ncbi:hypothetical protein [Salmonella phage vB_SentM_sal2]|nr:hypothetical protein [Salmonella phage vB_SentM_sal2]